MHEQVTKMNIVKTLPPNYFKIVQYLGEDKNAVYCYGDTIYNPFNRDITPDVEIHEEVHSKQQADIGVEVWYDLYLTDSEFRLQQEIEAYGKQYHWASNYVRGKLKNWLLEQLAFALSSDTYGNIISYKDAIKAIRTYKP